MELRSKQRILRLKGKVGVVGVINVTPDSYVPGSRAETPVDMLARAQECIDGGADIVEIGGESTGPTSKEVSVADELARVVPAVSLLRKNFPECWIAVDTYKSEVAREALAAGADMINDVTAGRGDPAMFALLGASDVPVVLMYAKDSSARTTIANPRYEDVVATIRDFLIGRIDVAKKAGITQIILDPGLGHFVSSDPAVSWEILARLSEFQDLGPIFVSPSRKSFLAGPMHAPVAERLPATLAASCLAAVRGASFIRTHDVRQTQKALQSIGGLL